ITDSLNLFDFDSGIFVPGVTHALDPNGGDLWGTGNYRQKGVEWERKCHFQLFNNDGELEVSQDVGIRTHGMGSTAYPQKSIRVYAKEQYGETKLEHELFPGLATDEFDVIVLRNMGQDFVSGVARDVLANEIAKPLNQATLAFRPVITFVNGEYWGIQNMRERFDKHFLQQFHDSHKDSIDIIGSYLGAVSSGDIETFNSLVHFLEDNDISVQSNYSYVASMMDIDDFIDNTLTKIYLGCYDWPGNNSRMWRERSLDGKFRWLLLDNDVCLWSGGYNSLEHATNPNSGGWPNPPESTLFLRKLLENDPFKQAFIARMAELLNSTFANKQIGYKLSELFEYYNPEYSEHQDRWSPLAENETLEDNYVNVLEVVRVRACHMREHFINYFNLSNREFPYSCDSSALHLNQNDVPEAIDKLHLFPVPNNGTFTVVTPNSMVGTLKASLYDLSGKLVYSNWWQAQTSTEQVIYTKGLAAGIYTFQVRSESETHHSKVIIQ
ncbi:MAG: CotH kinase family protein, partial [Flavobacteriales bacterium]